jgi:iron complex outermembrane receptor protein
VVAGIQSGNRLPSVPRTQLTGSATFRRPLGSAQAFLSATAHYIGSHYTQIDDLAAGFGTVDLNSFGANTIGGPLTQSSFAFDPLLPGYTIANLRTGISRPSWDAAIFVNNVGDTRALLALDRERGSRARVGYLTNQPRTAGVSMTFHY